MADMVFGCGRYRLAVADVVVADRPIAAGFHKLHKRFPNCLKLRAPSSNSNSLIVSGITARPMHCHVLIMYRFMNSIWHFISDECLLVDFYWA